MNLTPRHLSIGHLTANPITSVMYREPGVDYASYADMDVAGVYFEALDAIRPLWALLYPLDHSDSNADHILRVRQESGIGQLWFGFLHDLGPMAKRAYRMISELCGTGRGGSREKLDDILHRAENVLAPAVVMLEQADQHCQGNPEDHMDVSDALYHLFHQVDGVYRGLIAIHGNLGEMEDEETAAKKQREDVPDGAWTVLKDIPGVARAGDTIAVRGRRVTRHVRLYGTPIADHRDSLQYLGDGKKSAEQLNEDVGKPLDLPVRDMTEDPPEATAQ